ncbi:protein FAR1-RELATED SEQUENCE 6-like [Impatiens glandulifera]|uniref:protein FAR1-RELATED SEQUENCE 6-like n=1 Tax=Impatiens glandulifera TaxID=253017 RepID=UPI001FB09783|nr:protein FAR1-RELATED SEQUENCE 6-like [Impatiens glandulifera]
MQFQSVYTNDIFKLCQNEFKGLMFCDTSIIEYNGTTYVFGVSESILGINGQHLRDFSYKVQYNSVLVTLKCQCQMFEFRGLLCRHILAVLNRMKVNQVPAYYILDRWCKDLKRGYQIFTNIYDSDVCEIERNRYNYLTPIMLEVQQLASKSQVNCSALDEVMKDMKEKFKISPNCTTDSEPTKKVIHSPVKVRARGRPPTKRK